MSSYFDLNKFLSEPANIIDELYKDTPILIGTQEEFDNLPLNENYIRRKDFTGKKDENIKINDNPQEVVVGITHDENSNQENNNQEN
jgi:hypothetical protein